MMVRLIHLSRFFIAATVLAAAMLLAPSGAQAHAGHDHGPVQVDRSAPAPQASSAVQTQREVGSEVSNAQSTLWLAASSAPGGKGTTNCTGGCCQSVGHGCCAAALPALLTVGPPQTAVERLFAILSWGPGVTPGALPEPPRHLV
jgi:hypothetical protein